MRVLSTGAMVSFAPRDRAICLLRLGRKSDAKEALSRFARGEVGRGYRGSEASELAEALE